LAQAFAITVLGTAGTYVIVFYMPTFAVRELGFRRDQAFIASTICSLVYLVGNPVAGHVSDRIGRIFHLRLAAVLMAASALPLYLWLAADPRLPVLIAVEAVLGMLLAFFSGPSASAIGEIFPVRFRATGLSLAYSLAVPIFGGFAPYFVARLNTGDHLAPAWYIVGCAIPALAGLFVLRPRAPPL
jgi:MHS family proline/betaine transporter-like MFS transporter